ncbi:PhnE/PtxC family ABC transporter permease [Oenococcus kitaharae]|uniref:Phosphonate ABC transporter permease protein n=1 Tax=Oenococcus kitaharae DSM 17330 TaxID=1045004 RepID=G9WJ27_9LACO|nr:ABC transporter permease subunit [Oenococcus kitaharae]EHN58476.1 Phosphonate ABC transporter permease protein [Oenococcus kitaharae DSM 17330]MCV3296285.1 ABC transporter permease subunit [Oenococcus kitaharae]OEY81370.1 hypothetical protein NT95_07580 [Oenococcus kitaharae]OEY82858.1 hypothetical protein NV75_05680 [Oenococcus kitaharae]OEY84598.1 hypothetical protein NT96_04955 [Oenococcus kitaharae]
MIDIPKKSFLRKIQPYVIAIIILAIYIWAFAGIQFNGIQQMAGQITAAVFNGLVHPDWQFVSAPLDRWLNATFQTGIPSTLATADGEDLVAKLLQTVAIAFLGTFVSAFLAIPFAFLSARTEGRSRESWKQRAKAILYLAVGMLAVALIIWGFRLIFGFDVFPKNLFIFIFVLWFFESLFIVANGLVQDISKYTIFRPKSTNGKFILTFIRVFPEIVLALMFIKAVGPGSFAGVLALSVHSVGMLGKLDGEAIENLDRGPNEAIVAAGGTQLDTLTLATLPNAMPSFLSNTLYRFEISVRSASILGMVGAGGIGQDLILSTQVRNWPRAGIILIGVVIMVTLIDFISGQLRKRII